jgi:Terpene cyclase DEP1
VPYSQFIPWVLDLDHGFNMPLFIRELFMTRVGGFFGLEVLVSAIVLVVFVTVDGKRLRMRSRWVPIVALLLVGVSLALPLFLYLRELEIERTVT